jgi:hypothetical protein
MKRTKKVELLNRTNLFRKIIHKKVELLTPHRIS